MANANQRYKSQFKDFLEMGDNPRQAHLKLVAVHGFEVISQKTAYRWAESFKTS